ncbi:Redoxin [Exidia glandulosa HHB12029]|uniref:Putative peroxiredoxin n=1 Tax=Exidia glandulosa HHB12029 TaxID=1314781 RepID=A0A165EDA2_EXIGL|nr:Redoxin [Exidia glandulosa HHB12029]
MASTPTIKVGDEIPSATFTYVPWSAELEDKSFCGLPVPLKTDEWKGKKVVVVAVPGSFTRTCHGQVPGYLAHIGEFKSKGIDEVVVLASNDPFVQSGWGRFQGIKDEIKFISDTDLAFTSKLGLTLDLTARGLGVRAQRYVLVLDDLKVTKFWVEPNSGAVSVTGAEEVLKEL